MSAPTRRTPPATREPSLPRGITLLALAYVLVVPFQETWNPGGEELRPGSGMLLSATDVLFALLVFGLARHARAVRAYLAEVPYRRAWLAYAFFVCLAYLVAPGNSDHLTNPARAAYQLYRYCCKDALWYFLGALLWRPLTQGGALALAVTAAADWASVEGIQQGLSGDRAAGPFTHANEFGGFLAITLFIAASFFFFEERPRRRWFYAASGLLQLRALMFTDSRGAWVSGLLAGLYFVHHLYRDAVQRRRLVLACGSALVAVLAIPVVKPNVLQTDFMGRLTSVMTPAQDDNFVWRYQRWEHFLTIALDNPLLGTGEVEDASLPGSARTPHNGYLARAVLYGIPATCILVAFGVWAFRRARWIARHGRDPALTALALAFACGLIAVGVHNLEDMTLESEAVRTLLWTLAGTSIAAARTLATEHREPAPAETARAA